MKQGICFSKPTRYEFIEWTGTNLPTVKKFIHPSYMTLVSDGKLRIFMEQSVFSMLFMPGDIILKCPTTGTIHHTSKGTFETYYTQEKPNGHM